jgi:hypothetical protein
LSTVSYGNIAPSGSIRPAVNGELLPTKSHASLSPAMLIRNGARVSTSRMQA